MATLSTSQIATLAQQAGFAGNTVPIAVAICLAESSGNTTATHHNLDGSTDYGLWQINSIHTQYNPVLLISNPLYNAQAAYQISSGGRNWNPWTTYTSGAYKKYLQSASNPPPPTSTPGVKPWWYFPRVDNMGAPDPYGGFPKPDSNIQIPAGYPVIALLPGTVTSVVHGESWGASVTLVLDRPLNDLATHTSYIHLRSDIQVHVGQHVDAGQLIAYNGYSQAEGAQKVPLGFALYHGQAYGHDGWQYETYANVTGKLNPVPLLEAAKNGQVYTGGGSSGGGVGFPTGNYTYTSTQTYTPIMQQVHNTLISHPGFYGIALAVDEAEQFPGWIDLTDHNAPGPLPDFVGLARSIGATVTDNYLAFSIRVWVTSIGLFIILCLIMKPVLGIAGRFI